MGSKKAVSPLLAYILAVAITVVGIAIVLHGVLPYFTQLQETQAVETATQQMALLSRVVEEVASESVGSLRRVSLSVPEGKLLVDNLTSSLKFVTEITSPIFSPGTLLKRGSLTVIAGGYAKGYEEDIDGDGEVEIVVENPYLRVVFTKYQGETIFTNESIIETMTFKPEASTMNLSESELYVDGKIVEGVAQTTLLDKGDYLPSARVLLTINESGSLHSILYELGGSFDFLLVRPLGDETLTIKVPVRLGSSKENDVVRIPAEPVKEGPANSIPSGCYEFVP